MNQQVNTIYRIVLPSHAGVKRQRNFKRDIETIRKTNPGWVVVTDWVRRGEAQAFLVLPKGQEYAQKLLDYRVESSLSKTLLTGYRD